MKSFFLSASSLWLLSREGNQNSTEKSAGFPQSKQGSSASGDGAETWPLLRRRRPENL